MERQPFKLSHGMTPDLIQCDDKQVPLEVPQAVTSRAVSLRQLSVTSAPHLRFVGEFVSLPISSHIHSRAEQSPVYFATRRLHRERHNRI